MNSMEIMIWLSGADKVGTNKQWNLYSHLPVSYRRRGAGSWPLGLPGSVTEISTVKGEFFPPSIWIRQSFKTCSHGVTTIVTAIDTSNRYHDLCGGLHMVRELFHLRMSYIDINDSVFIRKSFVEVTVVPCEWVFTKMTWPSCEPS